MLVVKIGNGQRYYGFNVQLRVFRRMGKLSLEYDASSGANKEPVICFFVAYRVVSLNFSSLVRFMGSNSIPSR